MKCYECYVMKCYEMLCHLIIHENVMNDEMSCFIFHGNEKCLFMRDNELIQYNNDKSIVMF